MSAVLIIPARHLSFQKKTFRALYQTSVGGADIRNPPALPAELDAMLDQPLLRDGGDLILTFFGWGEEWKGEPRGSGVSRRLRWRNLRRLTPYEAMWVVTFQSLEVMGYVVAPEGGSRFLMEPIDGQEVLMRSEGGGHYQIDMVPLVESLGRGDHVVAAVNLAE